MAVALPRVDHADDCLRFNVVSCWSGWQAGSPDAPGSVLSQLHLFTLFDPCRTRISLVRTRRPRAGGGIRSSGSGHSRKQGVPCHECSGNSVISVISVTSVIMCHSCHQIASNRSVLHATAMTVLIRVMTQLDIAVTLAGRKNPRVLPRMTVMTLARTDEQEACRTSSATW